MPCLIFKKFSIWLLIYFMGLIWKRGYLLSLHFSYKCPNLFNILKILHVSESPVIHHYFLVLFFIELCYKNGWPWRVLNIKNSIHTWLLLRNERLVLRRNFENDKNLSLFRHSDYYLVIHISYVKYCISIWQVSQ